MTVKTEQKKKLSIEEMSALYDRIYNIADKLLKKHNPCNIHKGKIKAEHIYWKPKNPDRLINAIVCTRKSRHSNLCCGGCKYCNKGCTVKCLACKLFLCTSTEQTNRMLYKRFKMLRNYTTKHLDFTYRCKSWKEKFTYNTAYSYFKSKEQWLECLKERID